MDRRSGGAPDPTIVVSAPSARPKVAAVRQQSRLTFNRNGYDFAVDAHARTRRVSGELRLQEHARSRSAQRNAGKPDRRLTDEGGHFIAARFNGPRDWFNHFAQDRNFNRSAYQSLENEWARTIGSGKRVFVDIIPHYRGTSMRPYKLFVKWTSDGQERFQEFPNEKGRR